MRNNINTKKILQLLPSRLIALGFLVIILLGNYWFVFVVTKQPTPQWLWNCFVLCGLWIITCGLWLVVVILINKIKSHESGSKQ